MNKVFVRTKNVKKFVALMEEVKQLPANIPKIVLVFGEYGLGKSETIKWWTFKNDCIYVRANQGMTSRWLLSEIAEELGEEPFWHIQETFNLIEKKLKENPKPIIIDEVDYLLERNTIAYVFILIQFVNQIIFQLSVVHNFVSLCFVIH